MTTRHDAPCRSLALWPVVALACAAACATPAPPPEGDARPTPVYDKTTGRLETLVSDHNHDGKPDTWAHMDGPVLKSIDIDRDGDGRPDRWEYYIPASAAGLPGSDPIIDHADEADGPDQKTITRREFYLKGVLQRTEEDTDHDGRIDKWEYYDGKVLTRVEFDLDGHGYPDRRLVYGPDGNVVRVEVDPHGTGTFVPVPAASPARKGGDR